MKFISSWYSFKICKSSDFLFYIKRTILYSYEESRDDFERYEFLRDLKKHWSDQISIRSLF